jgi:deoxyadenosine/deoxycytidine kinase
MGDHRNPHRIFVESLKQLPTTITYVIVYVHAPIPVLLERLEERDGGAEPAELKKQRDRLQRATDICTSLVHTVHQVSGTRSNTYFLTVENDTSRDPGECATEIRQHIKEIRS